MAKLYLLCPVWVSSIIYKFAGLEKGNPWSDYDIGIEALALFGKLCM